MRSFVFCAILIGGLFSLGAVAIAAETKKPLEYPPVSENAALQYWQGFAMMSPLDPKQEKLLDSWAEAPLDESVNKLLEQTHASMMFLNRGAQRQQCDWGVDYRDGMSMLLPHLGKARSLARLAALDARLAFETKQGDRAREDAFGMVALARHAGRDHTFVSALVCYAIEGMTVDLVAPYLPGVSASYADAMDAYKTLPARPQLSEAMVCEKRLAGTLITKLQDAEKQQPDTWRKTWRTMLGNEGPDPLNDAENLEQAVAMIEKFMPVYDELSQLMSMPSKEFDAQYPAFAKRTEAKFPVAKILLPSVVKVMKADRRSEARMTMLLAGIAVVEGGPQELADIK